MVLMLFYVIILYGSYEYGTYVHIMTTGQFNGHNSVLI